MLVRRLAVDYYAYLHVTAVLLQIKEKDGWREEHLSLFNSIDGEYLDTFFGNCWNTGSQRRELLDRNVDFLWPIARTEGYLCEPRFTNFSWPVQLRPMPINDALEKRVIKHWHQPL
jgi:hypothetical protein